MGDFYDIYTLENLYIGLGVTVVFVSVGLSTLKMLVAFDLNIFVRFNKADWYLF